MPERLPLRPVRGRLPEADRRSVESGMTAARSRLINVLNGTTAVTGQLDLGVAKANVLRRLEAMAPQLSRLPQKDYRAFVGFLHMARDKNSDVAFLSECGRLRNDARTSPQLRAILDECLALHRDWGKSKDPAFSAERYFGRPLFGGVAKDPDQADFAEQLLLFARLAYPGGVNMVNPEEVPNWPSGIPSDQSFLIGNDFLKDKPEGIITVNPVDKHTVRIKYVNVKDVGGKKVKKTRRHNLRRGESVVIGRDLRVESLMGIPLKEQVAQAVQCDVGDTLQYSRGGLVMSFLPSGMIGVFDRGSISPYKILSEGVMVDYKPTAVRRNERWEFGQSEIRSVKKPKPQGPQDVGDTEVI